MPSADEYCEVRAGGSIYRDWTSLAVEWSLDKEWMRQFRLQVAEPDVRTLRLGPQDRVDVLLAGQPAIIQGVIASRQAGFDATRHGVQIDGVSKAALAQVASIDVPGGQFRDYTLEAIANAVLGPLGIKFRVDGSPSGADIKFPNVAVRHGEAPIDLIRRLCKQRALRIGTDPDGTIVVGRAKDGGGDVLEEGVNILSARSQIQLPWIEAVKATAQRPGSDEVGDRQAAEVSAKAMATNGMKGAVLKVLAEMPLSPKETQLRANWEMANLQERWVQVSVVHKGWLRPSGGLWELRKPVRVRSKKLFPTASGEETLYVFGVLCVQDAQAGSTTTVDLRTYPAMGQGYGDATKPDGFYNPSAGAAQSEAST